METFIWTYLLIAALPVGLGVGSKIGHMICNAREWHG